MIEAARPSGEALLLNDAVEAFPGDWARYNRRWQKVRQAGMLLVRAHLLVPNIAAPECCLGYLGGGGSTRGLGDVRAGALGGERSLDDSAHRHRTDERDSVVATLEADD